MLYKNKYHIWWNCEELRRLEDAKLIKALADTRSCIYISKVEQNSVCSLTLERQRRKANRIAIERPQHHCRKRSNGSGGNASDNQAFIAMLFQRSLLWRYVLRCANAVVERANAEPQTVSQWRSIFMWLAASSVCRSCCFRAILHMYKCITHSLWHGFFFITTTTLPLHLIALVGKWIRFGSVWTCRYIRRS